MIKNTLLSTLVEDFSFYPRMRVDETHVSDLLRSLSAGHELPPLIACAESLRVVDGFHRRRAYLKQFGPDAKAKVDLRKFDTDAALFLAAVEANSHHGRKLDRQDQSRIVLRLRELQVEDQTIAVTLHVPVQQIQTLAVRVVYDSTNTAIPSKRGIEHLRGQHVSDDQLKVLQSVRSAEAGRLALELSRLLDAGLVDLADDQVRDRLASLQKSIASALRSVAA